MSELKTRDLAGPSLGLKQLLRLYNNASGVISSLAVERFALNEARGEHWILTIQDAELEPTKVTDGKIILLGLPDDADEEESALQVFVSTYNALVIRAADDKARAGEWKEAEVVYRLLLQHDRTTAYREALEARLKLVQKAKEGTGKDTLVAELNKLKPDFHPWTMLGDMGLRPAKKVKDLLKVDINKLEAP